MHNPFQKLGFFLSKEDPKESTVKYSPKKESELGREKKKRKIKSANDASSEKYSKKTDKHKSRRKKSISSIERKQRKKESSHKSDTEIFYISPEELKRHRRKFDKPSEKGSERRRKSTDSEKHKLLKKQKELEKLIKEQQHKKYLSKDEQWLNKTELYKIISNVKQSPKDQKAALLNKFFVIDNEGNPFDKEPEKRKISHKHPDKTAVIPVKTTVTKKIEPNTGHTKRKEIPDIVYSSDYKKHGEKKKTQPKIETVKKEKKNQTDMIVPRFKQVRTKEEGVNTEEQKSNVKQVNLTRHRHCLVKNTFSVVAIPPTDTYLEKKKKWKTFKKYYKYNNDKESDVSSTVHAWSDSHKMYQDLAEKSAEDLKKQHKASAERPKRRKLQSETHSTVSIAPEPNKKSKIPVADINKIVQLAKDLSCSPKSHKLSTDFFKPKFLENVFSPREESVSADSDAVPNEDFVARSKQNSSLTEKSTHSCKNNSSDYGKDLKSFAVPLSNPPRRKEIDKNTDFSSEEKNRCDRDVVKSTKPNKIPEKINSGRPIRPKTGFNKHQGNDLNMIEDSVIKSAPTTPHRKTESVDKNTQKLRNNKKESASFDSHKTPEKSRRDLKSTTISSSNKAVISRNPFENTPKSSPENSSVWSKGSRRNLSRFASKSDTKLQEERKKNPDQKHRTCERNNNNTFEDKHATSYLLTKSYKDDDKVNRWQKRKEYADFVRKNAIGTHRKATHPQVLEVRYLTVQDVENTLELHRVTSDHSLLESKNLDFCKNDLPEPCLELIDDDKFKDLFDLPTDEALNEILKENSQFLKKDFNFTPVHLSESEDVSSEDEWLNFNVNKPENISCWQTESVPETNFQSLTVGSEDCIIDSLSAPGSEESGYATVKQLSKSFFKKPEIKALLEPPFENSSTGLDIESKSVQTAFESSQKSVQIQISKENFSEMINCSTSTPEQLLESTKLVQTIVSSKNSSRVDCSATSSAVSFRNEISNNTKDDESTDSELIYVVNFEENESKSVDSEPKDKWRFCKKFLKCKKNILLFLSCISRVKSNNKL